MFLSFAWKVISSALCECTPPPSFVAQVVYDILPPLMLFVVLIFLMYLGRVIDLHIC